MVYSFDIFDTLITRKTYSPSGIFFIMQEKIIEKDLLPRDISNNFSSIRINAEKNARLWSEFEEVTLQEIYNAMKKMTHINSDKIKLLMKLELEVEIEMSVALSNQIVLLKEKLYQGNRIILISDMYMDKDSIKRILCHVDSVFENIEIYVSSEFKTTKHSGNLFKIVKKLENINDEWIHFGDNEFSDYRVPKLMGIQAQLIVNRYYTLWNQFVDSNNLSNMTSELIMGLTKNTIVESKRCNIAYEIGASLGGYILWPYVKWIVDLAILNNVKSLYFFARDGFLLKKMADIYINSLNCSIKSRYVYASRKSLREGGDKKAFLAYFDQMIGGERDAYFVDLQGTGESMKCLIKNFSEFKKIRFHIFYYVMLENRLEGYAEWMAYTSKNVRSPIELFCRAPHGATIGYKFVQDKAIPVIKEIDKKIWLDAQLDEYIKGVCEWTENVCCLDMKVRERINWNAVSDAALKFVIQTKNEELLDFLGNLPHDEMEYSDMKYAPLLSDRDIYLNYFKRTYKMADTYYSGADINMSLRRATDSQIKRAKWFCKHYDSVIGKLIHLKKIRIPILENRRVIVYGAGKIGEDVYKFLHGVKKCKVVAWVDKNDDKCVSRGLNVIPIEKLQYIEYDMLIIALAGSREQNRTLIEISDFLNNIGITNDKIVFWQELEKTIQNEV